VRQRENNRQEVLSATTSVTTTDTFRIAAANNTQVGLDNIQILSDSLSSSYSYAYDTANELTSMSGPDGTTFFGYDELGRMTFKARGSVSATYTYNYDSRLVEAASSFPDEGTVTYDYGADGKRRQRVEGSNETWYNRGAGYAVMGEEDGTGTLQHTYVDGLAQIDGTSPSTGTYAYFWRDHVGSTRELYDGSKNETGSFEYSPFGDPLLSENSSITNHRYVSLDWDNQTGCYIAPYRNYSPTESRWTSREPSGDDGPNLYAYVGNNPVNKHDPTGLLTVRVFGGVGEEGGYLDFGYNNGHFSFHIGTGPGLGLGASIDPSTEPSNPAGCGPEVGYTSNGTANVGPFDVSGRLTGMLTFGSKGINGSASGVLTAGPAFYDLPLSTRPAVGGVLTGSYFSPSNGGNGGFSSSLGRAKRINFGSGGFAGLIYGYGC